MLQGPLSIFIGDEIMDQTQVEQTAKEKVEIVRTPVKAKAPPIEQTPETEAYSKETYKEEDFAPGALAFRYGNEFQVKILNLMVQDFDFLTYVAPHLKPEHFTSKTLAGLYSTITNTYEKHKCAITYAVLTDEVDKLVKAKKIDKDDIKIYVKRLAELNKPLPDAPYVKSEVEDFIKHMSLEVAIVQAVALHKKGKYEQAQEVFNTSCEQADFHSSQDYNPLDKTYLKETLKSRAEIFEHPEKHRGISTGIPPLDDKLFWRGLGRKELGVVMAPPNGGKSPFLLHVATAALKEHTTIFYTLEIDQLIFDLRLHANLTGLRINDLPGMPAEDVEEAVEDREKGLKGKLLVHDLPGGDLTPAKVERDIEGYKRRGIVPDLIVIDYADIMKPDSKWKERRHEFTDIYNSLRSIAKKHNVGVWTASQSNRASYKKNTIKLDDIAEDWGKAMIADYIIGLCQSAEEAKAKPQKMRLFLAKNRNGEKGIVVDTRVDFARMRMHVTVPAEEDEKEEYGSKKPKVKEMIEDGCTAEEVVKETGCDRSYYFKVKKEVKAEKDSSDET